MKSITHARHSLNAICPYFTMFPLHFPLSILASSSHSGEWVLDPFCGRGTTNLAARLLALPSVGIDSSPVGAAVAEAKIISATPAEIVEELQAILADNRSPVEVPQDEFWELAYHEETLEVLCRLRESLAASCQTSVRKALRAVILGALHGPRNKGIPSYFSNQSPRTYAPKPRYATAFWRERGLRPHPVDVVGIISRRAERYFSEALPESAGEIRLGDSRRRETFDDLNVRFRWVITSPPYYGMKTYIPDQWIRNWFLGGSSTVDYSYSGQLSHCSSEEFTADLTAVWERVRDVCRPDVSLVVRFGAIADRAFDPLALLCTSLETAGWTITEVVSAGNAQDGRRQADHFVRNRKAAMAEHDVWAATP